MNISLSLKLLVGFAVLSTVSSQAIAADDRREAKREAKLERRAERRVDSMQTRAINQVQKDQRRVENRVNRPTTIYVPPQVNVPRDNDNRWGNRPDVRPGNHRWDNHSSNRPDTHHYWDNNWRNNGRLQASNNRYRNWNDRRDYLKANLRKLNQIAKLNALQQQQLDAQMQAAFLQYHNNSWNGPYNYDYYSEPQFLDYLQANEPSLLEKILGYLGIGGGLGTSSYLYSSDWDTERSELGQNMYRIHQLALEGRITPLQEQQLLAQMRAEFSTYHNNNWNGTYGWSQYSDPGFIDYLNTSRPSVLTTVRSYLGM